MNVYLDLFFIELTIVYVVDLSGFTQSWRGALARLLGVKSLRPLKPFDCGQCLTWWVCLIYAIATGHFALPVVAYIAGLSFLSVPLGQFMIFIREGLTAVINKLFRLC